MNFFFIKLICLSFICSLQFVKNAAATEVTIGVESLEYLPFYDGKGRSGYNGFARDLFDQFAKDKGHKVTYVPVKVSALFKKYKAGSFDFKFPDNSLWKKDERNGIDIKYSDVVLKTQMGVISLSENSQKPLTNVGIVEGFTPWALLDSVKAGKIKLVEKSKMKHLIKLLMNKDIDGIYGSIDVLTYHSKKSGTELKVAFNKNVKTSTDEFYLSAVKNVEVLDDFKKWFKSNSDTVFKIKSKHGVK
jgi:ABC-type amino acid transport substrate-binding protein